MFLYFAKTTTDEWVTFCQASVGAGKEIICGSGTATLTGKPSPVLLQSNSSVLCLLVFNQSLIKITENNEITRV